MSPTPYPGELSRAEKTTASGTAYTEVTVYPQGVGDVALVCVPARRRDVLLLCAHGHNGSEQTINNTQMVTTRDAHLDRGWVVAAPYAHGNAWANDAALADYVRLHAWVATVLGVSATVLHGQSMGGLTTANLLARRAVPGVRAMVTIDAAMNLARAYLTASYKTAIKAAYGIAADDSDYAALTAGHDACLLDPALFEGTRILSEASTGDTAIPKANHQDVWIARIAGRPRVLSTLTGTGTHVAAENYFPDDVAAFTRAQLMLDAPLRPVELRTPAGARARAYRRQGDVWIANNLATGM